MQAKFGSGTSIQILSYGIWAISANVLLQHSVYTTEFIRSQH